jgi:hypothetical protein
LNAFADAVRLRPEAVLSIFDNGAKIWPAAEGRTDHERGVAVADAIHVTAPMVNSPAVQRVQVAAIEAVR